jgi:outer membrane lipoprotein-sorting protein
MLRAVVVLAMAGSLPSFAADAFTARSLMETLARNRTSQADFVEKKYLAALNQPIESSGQLVYVAPTRLEKRTVKPRPETLIVDGDVLTIERAGTKRSISLASYPEVSAFVESLRATLGGDLDTLMRSYKVVVDGSPAKWRLSLLPSDPKIAALVNRVTVDGRDGVIDTIEVLQADGSRSVTTVVPVPVAR